MSPLVVTTEYVPTCTVRQGDYVARWDGRQLVPARVIDSYTAESGHLVFRTTEGNIPTGFKGQLQRVLFPAGEAPHEREAGR